MAAEVVERLRAALPAKLFDVLWLHLTEGLTLAKIGRRFRFGHHYASQLLEKGMKLAKEVG